MSKSERRRFEVGETKEFVFHRDDWTCQVCGKQVTPHNAQLAHLIPQSKAMLKKWGPEVIHHEANLLTTCSLECNNAVQTNYEEEQWYIAHGIYKAIGAEVIDNG